jgi:putative membrane protein
MTPVDPIQQPFDPGLQVERTALAWRRTGLALVVLAVAAARALSSQWGARSIAAAAIGVAGAVALMLGSHLRHRTQHLALTTTQHERIPLPGGTLLCALAILDAVFGLTALAFTLAHSGGA